MKICIGLRRNFHPENFWYKTAANFSYLFLVPPQCLQRAFNKTVDVISQFVQYEARFDAITCIFCLVFFWYL